MDIVKALELSSSSCQNISKELLRVGCPHGSSFILSNFVTVNLQNVEKWRSNQGSHEFAWIVFWSSFNL
jgi:hypothetical protein